MSEKSNDFNTLYLELEIALDNYINSFNNIELLVFDVAKQQLESSFELHKSIGFIKYLKDNNITILNK
tara:strand:- start:1211 stop:1414 length:204 start_codon:yes stop_codon:yes gene_type:complete